MGNSRSAELSAEYEKTLWVLGLFYEIFCLLLGSFVFFCLSEKTIGGEAKCGGEPLDKKRTNQKNKSEFAGIAGGGDTRKTYFQR